MIKRTVLLGVAEVVPHAHWDLSLSQNNKLAGQNTLILWPGIFIKTDAVVVKVITIKITVI